MTSHIIDGEFQSDKYPTTPRGKVPLSVKDRTAQDLLWQYAQRRRVVDSEFADDLEIALKAAGYEPPAKPDRPDMWWDVDDPEQPHDGPAEWAMAEGISPGTVSTKHFMTGYRGSDVHCAVETYTSGDDDVEYRVFEFDNEAAAKAKADALNASIVSRCGECETPLRSGDKVHICRDGDPIFCAAHAYTWAQVEEDMKESIAGGDGDEGLRRTLEACAARRAEGLPMDEKMLHDL